MQVALQEQARPTTGHAMVPQVWQMVETQRLAEYIRVLLHGAAFDQPIHLATVGWAKAADVAKQVPGRVIARAQQLLLAR